jgi:hypothetical protein
MIRLDYFPRSRTRQLRRELSAAGEDLRAAAEQNARKVGKRSRRAGKIARDRMASAALALRGQHEPRWPWLATGLAAGLAAGAVIGAAGAGVTRRWRSEGRTPAQQVESATSALREKAGTAAETVRERANAATTKLRGRDTRPDTTGQTNATPVVSEPMR